MKINQSKIRVSKPADIYELMKKIYEVNSELDRDREQLYLIGMDTRNNTKFIELISLGTIDETLVSTREVYRTALYHNVNAIILVHNHPSGECTPSDADIIATERIAEAGKIIGITLMDHIIYTEKDFYSMKGSGNIK